VNRQLLPPGARCTAYWYAQAAGLPCDLASLLALGRAAAHAAAWSGIPPAKVAEGPYLVHTWPQQAWDEAAGWLARQAAEHGSYGPYQRVP
jgi:hypothetical protein